MVRKSRTSSTDEPLTLNTDVVNVTGGGLTVATSCVAAATMRPIASRTCGWLRIPSGVNSEGCIGSWREGKGFPSLSQILTTVSTEEEMMSLRAIKSLVIIRELNDGGNNCAAVPGFYKCVSSGFIDVSNTSLQNTLIKRFTSFMLLRLWTFLDLVMCTNLAVTNG